MSNVNYREKVAIFEHFVNIFCSLVLFDVFHHNYHVWMEIVLQIQFHLDFPILANFAAFLDHTKENADVSTNDEKF